MWNASVQGSEDPSPYVSWLLDLRSRLSGSREGRAIVDRCLDLIARAADPGAMAQSEVDAELQRIADDLALRFGRPSAATLQ
jgi:hypothetical protein